MFSSKLLWICVLLTVVGTGIPASARPPVRQTSDNGQGAPDDPANVDTWDLLGQSIPIKLTANGKSVTMKRQVICAEAGGDRQPGGFCLSGKYLFLFQLQSTSTSVPINIGNLQGFTESGGDDTGTYGVMICDDPNPSQGHEGNDMELCTEDPNDPGYSLLNGITFSVKSKTAVTFTIPSFPAFSAGPQQPQEGQGLTLFVVTQQGSGSPIPIPYPSIGD